MAGSPFTCILDTGSSDFAISADSSSSCKVHYGGIASGRCAGGVSLAVSYMDANFSAISCRDEVQINGINLGEVTFAA